MTQAGDFAKRSQAIARSFLQTVVVVDDHPHYLNNGASPKPERLREPESVMEAIGGWKGSPAQSVPIPGDTSAPLDSNALAAGETQDTGTSTGRETEPEHEIDSRTLVDGLADLGLVCGLLVPATDDPDVPAKAVRAAHRADVVVLDWHLLGDRGETALGILEQIVTGDVDGRLRVIAIYTGQATILPIVDEVRKRLDQTLSNLSRRYELVPVDDFTVQAGPIRVSVFAKPNALIHRSNEALWHRMVSEDQLPERLIAEFAAMTGGLVSNVALKSLCVLRERTYELLGRLHSRLDAPFLAHRALLDTPDDADDQIASVVASEIAELIYAASAGEMAGKTAIQEWIAGHSDREWRLGSRPSKGSKLTVEEVLDLVLNGASKSRAVKNIKKPHLSLTPLFCPDDGADALDFEFARLTSMSDWRSKDGVSRERNVPFLSLGTVLQRIGAQPAGDDETYWLCVQPRCDSVRLPERRRFPLIPLLKVDDSRAFRVVAINQAGMDVRLCPELKPYELNNMWFAAGTGNGPIFATRRDHDFLFSSLEDGDYLWLGDLKHEQAQRIAHEFASQMSRVGLEESEWLRRSAQRG